MYNHEFKSYCLQHLLYQTGMDALPDQVVCYLCILKKQMKILPYIHFNTNV